MKIILDVNECQALKQVLESDKKYGKRNKLKKIFDNSNDTVAFKDPNIGSNFLNLSTQLTVTRLSTDHVEFNIPRKIIFNNPAKILKMINMLIKIHKTKDKVESTETTEPMNDTKE